MSSNPQEQQPVQPSAQFSSSAPFDRLVRVRLYRPYIQRLEQIGEETSAYFAAPAATLTRYVSQQVSWGERAIGWLKKPAKDVLAIARGEFVVAHLLQ